MGRDILIIAPPWVDFPHQGSNHKSKATLEAEKEKRSFDFQNQVDLNLAVDALAKLALKGSKE